MNAHLSPGARVAFFGPVTVRGQRVPEGVPLTVLCTQLGLTHVADTSCGVDLVVSDSPIPGCATVTHAEFAAWADGVLDAREAAPQYQQRQERPQTPTGATAPPVTAPSYPSFPSVTPAPLPARTDTTSSAVVPADGKNPWKPVISVGIAFFVIVAIGAATVDPANEAANVVMGCIIIALMVAFVVLFGIAVFETIRKFFR